MSKKKLIVFILITLIELKQVLAYIDPGTAGTIIGGSIWPFIVAIFGAIGVVFLKFFKPIKRGISATWQKIKRKE